MTSPVCTLDLARMRREPGRQAPGGHGRRRVDTLVLCGQTNVSYATGARVPASDHVRAAWWRAVAVLERDDPWPHLYTEFPEGSAPELPDDHIHPAVEVEATDGANELVAKLPAGGSRSTTRRSRSGRRSASARCSTPRSCSDRPSSRRPSTSSNAFARRRRSTSGRCAPCAPRRGRARSPPISRARSCAIAELGATSNTVDPVFQVMPRSIAAGPYSVTGDPVFPLPTQPRKLEAGDVMWIDTGINLNGYASDFGATWIIGDAPHDHARAQFDDWRGIVDRVLAVTKPGATGADLARAAGERNGRRPWLSYFYLAHGIGTDSAEMPLIGTDLGNEFDASIVLQPGMVLVLEPVIWDDGEAGHRSEEIVAITDDGYLWLSSRAELDGPAA